MKYIIKTFVPSLIVVFVFFIFYDLAWDAPFYFHPDERNIATSVSSLNITKSMDPKFYAYGSLPIYTIYFSGLLINFAESPFSFRDYNVSFEHALVIGRFYSSLLAILIVYLTFKLAQKLTNRTGAIVAVLLSVTSVAYLQYSHFATFEMWLTFFYLLMTYLLYSFLKTLKIKYFLFAAIVSGLSIGVKISSIILLPIVFLAIFIVAAHEKSKLRRIAYLLNYFLILFYILFLTFIFTNPYVIFNTVAFVRSIDYEAAVALGALPVFYTQSFYDTVPLLFQYSKVLPFLLNPLLALFSLFAIPYVIYSSIKKKDIFISLFIIALLTILISQSVLFVKWARYLVPAVPFFYIVVTVFLMKIKNLVSIKVWNLFILIVITFSSIYSFSFIKTVRLAQDTRVEAASFAKNNIVSEVKILSETYDMGIVAFNNHFENISLYNFYELDGSTSQDKSLNESLAKGKFIILPSQRVLQSRLGNSNSFPKGNKFYSELFNTSKFKKIYETPCDVFCKFLYLGDPIFYVEETVNIFDRPTVFIFEKID